MLRRESLKNAKFRWGGGTLVALSLVTFGSLMFSAGENVKATPGILGKRPTPSGGHLNLTNPPPTKRQRVELAMPPMYVLEGLNGKDIWFNRGEVKGVGLVTTTSTRRPKLLGYDRDYKVYLTGNPLGGPSFTSIKNGSGWYSPQDIIFTTE